MPAGTGSITATPNPIRSSAGQGKTKLAWASEGVTDVEIHVGSPDGPLLARSTASGRALAGPWVADGTTFFLQDVSAGRALSAEGTLDCVIVRVMPPREGTPDKIYEFASYLGQAFGCTRIVLAGLADDDAVSWLATDFGLVGVGPRGVHEETVYESWIEQNLDEPAPISLPDSLLQTALILCSDTQGCCAKAGPLLDHLSAWLHYAPVCLVTARSIGPEQLETLLRARGFNVTFAGLAVTTPPDQATALAVIERGPSPSPQATPSTFRVTAIMTAYNEEDIIVPSIARLLDQRIAVHLVENWSTDATHQLAGKFSGHELFTMERFPKDGPSPAYQWQALLRRVEEISQDTDTDWLIHQDVDEIRASPWPNLGLREALYRVDQAGFTCVDHTVLEFYPVDNFFPFGGDLETHLRWFDFGRRFDHFVQIKTWKKGGQRVALAESGGHEVRFPGRRPYPYKFLLKHYPIRSQSHGEKKVFVDRKARWDPDERAKGWHRHYDSIDEGHRFLRDREALELFEEARFSSEYLIERLSGVGIRRA